MPYHVLHLKMDSIWDELESIESRSSTIEVVVSMSLGGQVVSSGGGNSGLVNRDHCTVGVGDQLEVEVEGTSVAETIIRIGSSSNIWA